MTTRRRCAGLGTYRLRPIALLSEAAAGAFQRPWRAVLTAAGAIIGVAAAIAVLGITSTAQGQISTRFNELIATEVRVDDIGASTPDLDPISFPHDADQRAEQVQGVKHAGVSWQVRTTPPLRVTTVLALGQGAASDDVTVVAASPGFLPALRPAALHGRLFERLDDDRQARVAVVGSAAATRLNISNLAVSPIVFIDGIPFTVIGIVFAVERSVDVVFSIMIPRQVAEYVWGPPDLSSRASMVVDTEVGAAQVVGRQLPLALRPDAPTNFRVVTPPDPKTLREGIATDLKSLFLLLALLSLVVGAAGIANNTLIAVMERVPEIGLRRALGARRRHIVAQFLTESGWLGTLGGVLGASIGTIAVVTVAALKQWTPVMELWVPLLAPTIGTIVGLFAGFYPAIRAARVDPATALRQ